MNIKSVLATLLLFVSLTAHVLGQTTVYFSEGLAAGPFHQYGREAIYKDELTYLLNAGQLPTPRPGSVSMNSEKKEVTWKSVQADSAHRFRANELANGYLYLSYDSPKAQQAVLNVTGNDMTYVNGAPRGGDIYRYGWMDMPIQLKKGKNEFYVRSGRFGRFGGIVAKLTFPDKPVYLNTADLTMPHVVPGMKNDSLWVGLVIVNTSTKALTGLTLTSTVAGQSLTVEAPVIPALSTRKVGVLLNASNAVSVGKQTVSITLAQNNRSIDHQSIELETIAPGKQYSRTFISETGWHRTVLFGGSTTQPEARRGTRPFLFGTRGRGTGHQPGPGLQA